MLELFATPNLLTFKNVSLQLHRNSTQTHVHMRCLFVKRIQAILCWPCTRQKTQ